MARPKGFVLSAEQKAAMQAGRLARKDKLASSTLRRDFMDNDEWERLASKYKVRLPSYGVPANVTDVNKVLRKLNIDTEVFLEYNADKTMKGFIEHNPDWPSRAIVGLVLEYHAKTNLH